MMSEHPISTGFRGLTGCQWDPRDRGRHTLVKVIMGKGDVIVREEKDPYYQKDDQRLQN